MHHQNVSQQNAPSKRTLLTSLKRSKAGPPQLKRSKKYVLMVHFAVIRFDGASGACQFLTKTAQKFPQKFLSLYSVGPAKFPPKFPNFPAKNLKKSPTSFCRSAGRRFFTDFFTFCPTGLFHGFCRRIFSHFCGRKCPEKSSRKIPGKILQNVFQQKSPTIFCRGARPGWLQEVSHDFLGNGPNAVSENTASNTELSQLFGPSPSSGERAR